MICKLEAPRLALTLCLLAGAAAGQEKLMSLDGGQADSFGYSLALEGDACVVGAFRDDDAGTDAGSAYLRVLAGGTWTDPLKVLPDEGHPWGWFGFDVALSGPRAAVAAPGSGAAASGAGRVYTYQGSENGIFRTAVLENDTGAADDLYGRSIAISGDLLVVGAPRDGTWQPQGGAIHVYRDGASGWQLEAKLAPSDLGPFDYFGHAVAIAGTRIVASAYADDDAGTNAGAVYVIERMGSVWRVTQKLAGSRTTHHDNFGSSVAISGTRLVVGAPGADTPAPGAGNAYVFQRSGGVWIEEARLESSEGAENDGFGISVAVHADQYVMVGASHNDVYLPNDGAAYTYTRSGIVWLRTVRLTAPDPSAYAYLGLDVAVSDEWAMAGAFGAAGATPGEGAVYCLAGEGFQEVPDGTPIDQVHWAQSFCFCAEGPCGNADHAAGCSNSTGSGALLAAGGSPSVLADDLTLAVTGVVPETLVMLYMGAPTVPVPIASGQLCVGTGALGRYPFPVQIADRFGDSAYGPRLALFAATWFPPPGQVLAGQTWAFQVCYRDDDSPCAWITNWTNAVAVTFTL